MALLLALATHIHDKTQKWAARNIQSLPFANALNLFPLPLLNRESGLFGQKTHQPLCTYASASFRKALNEISPYSKTLFVPLPALLQGRQSLLVLRATSVRNCL